MSKSLKHCDVKFALFPNVDYSAEDIKIATFPAKNENIKSR